MNDDQTPINARPRRRRPEAFEDAGLALREHLVWPIEDRLLGLSGRGRAALAGGAVAVAVGLGIGAASLGGSGGAKPAPAPVAAAPEKAPQPAAETQAAPEEPQPTLHGAAPVFKPAPKGQAATGESEAASVGPVSSADSGNPATDTISSSPAAEPAGSAASASASAPTASVEGPPAGPAAIAVARKFAEGFVVYETGGEASAFRRAFAATTTPELKKALLRRPPHQPAAVKVPEAKVLNIVAAPSHGSIYPLSVSLLRVGVTSELRLEMEKLKGQGWRVTNVLG
jgi:collagen type IV alpha